MVWASELGGAAHVLGELGAGNGTCLLTLSHSIFSQDTHNVVRVSAGNEKVGRNAAWAATGAIGHAGAQRTNGRETGRRSALRSASLNTQIVTFVYIVIECTLTQYPESSVS